jgi:hypothetical protein
MSCRNRGNTGPAKGLARENEPPRDIEPDDEKCGRMRGRQSDARNSGTIEINVCLIVVFRTLPVCCACEKS